MIETFILFLSIRGRINFFQLARYRKRKVQRYRQQFEKHFDFLSFNNHAAFHLEKIQTLNFDNQSLVFCYVEVISDRKQTLTSLSKYLVAYAWSFKRSFAYRVISSGMQLASRLRDDTDLKYLCNEPPIGKRGRPGKYSSKITISDIDKEYYTFITRDKEQSEFAAEVFSKALKQNIMFVHVYPKLSGKDSTKLYLGPIFKWIPVMY